MTRIRLVLAGSRWMWVELDEQGNNLYASDLYAREEACRASAAELYGDEAILGPLEVWPPE